LVRFGGNDMRALQDIIDRHDKVAFLIGNGPNLAANLMPSWNDLLKSVSDKPIRFPVDGLSNTEVYDLVEMNSNEPNKAKENVKDKLVLPTNANLTIHRRLMELALDKSCPVLTTNFDEAFEKSIDATLFHIESKSFTHFYPWKTYYGKTKLTLPTDGFGIWKVHGDVRYTASIRLGLTDYMGSAERARKLIHNGEDRLFSGKRREFWSGHQTWLHIWFNLPIVIFGFTYGVNEVFLRWLLIERKRYLNIYQSAMNVYYISRNAPAAEVLNLMRNLGVEIVLINDYAELYG